VLQATRASQTIAVSGSNFQPGLTVTVGLPGGGTSSLSGTQIRNVTSGSFQTITTLADAGTYTLRVNNPIGPQSGVFTFSAATPPAAVISVTSAAERTATSRDQTTRLSGKQLERRAR
jgi:hypothetical protein